MNTYKIIRMYSRTTADRFETKSRALAGHSGLTLEQAQAHCQRDDTHTNNGTNNGTGRKSSGWDWFDGYTDTHRKI